MEWFKKHADTAVVLSTLIGSIMWMNTRFNEFDRRFYEIEKRMAIIETVLMCKGIMPNALAKIEEK